MTQQEIQTKCKAFWLSEEVKAAQEIQGSNPWGSNAHKAAHDSIVETAKKMDVLVLIKDLELYD